MSVTDPKENANSTTRLERSLSKLHAVDPTTGQSFARAISESAPGNGLQTALKRLTKVDPNSATTLADAVDEAADRANQPSKAR